MDDYAPWRAFVASTFQKHQELKIVAEATNGLEAVQIAQLLQPDLILLDIGLPELNGLEAASRIRNVCPQSRILFASENRSTEIVRAALSTGAGGFLAKSDAATELIPAINAVLAGNRYVSARLSGHDLANDPRAGAGPQKKGSDPIASSEKVGIARCHEVGFYSDDSRLLDHVGRLIETALRAGNAVIVVATESHRENLLSRLRGAGPDVHAAIEEGRYFPLDAQETLSSFMVNGVLDPIRFLELFGNLVVAAMQTAKGEHPHVSVFGEGVQLLWERGHAEVALQIEKLTNKLIEIHDVNILCGYSLSSVEIAMDQHLFQQISAEHSAVYSQ